MTKKREDYELSHHRFSSSHKYCIPSKIKKSTATKKETLRVINHFCKHSLFVKYELKTKCNSILSTYVLS